MIAHNGPKGFRIKVELDGITPPIWRRFCVPQEISLGDMHHLLQIVMGWNNCHLHEFRFLDRRIGPLDFLDAPDDLINEEEVFLDEIFTQPGIQLTYLYDFSEDWTHTLTYEGPLHMDEAVMTVLDGQRACPPEDCGGVVGYADLLEIQANPNHPDHDDVMAWLGEPIDPEAIDLDDLNEGLASWDQTQQILLGDDTLADEELASMMDMDYDADDDVDPDQWLELDDTERILAIQAYHELIDEEIPNATLHAVIHCVIETQLAEGLVVPCQTLERLILEGLDRHDAIHAMGSVLAQHLFDILNTDLSDPKSVNPKYLEGLKRLDAQIWLAQFDQDPDAE